MRQHAGDARVQRGVWSAVSAASGIVALACALAACSSPAHFPGQLPNSGAFVTNVSSAKAFQDHDIKVPGNVSALSYMPIPSWTGTRWKRLSDFRALQCRHS